MCGYDNLKRSHCGFVFDAKGLIADISLKRAKFSKVDKKRLIRAAPTCCKKSRYSDEKDFFNSCFDNLNLCAYRSDRGLFQREYFHAYRFKQGKYFSN
jgi:hypothetical protein